MTLRQLPRAEPIRAGALPPPRRATPLSDGWVETAFSMSTVVTHTQHMRHRVAAYFEAHLGFLVALFNLLTGWYGLPANADGFVPLSIAEFSL